MASKRIPSYFELNKMIDCLWQEDSRMAHGLLVGLFEELTVGELCALQWRDIDLDQGVLFVGRGLKRMKSMRDDGTKTALNFFPRPGHERWITVQPDTRRLLERWRGKISAEEYLLRDERPHEPSTVIDWFEKLARKAGIRGVTYRRLQVAYKTRREIFWSEKLAALPEMDAWVQGSQKEAFADSFRRLEKAGFTKEDVIEVLKKKLEAPRTRHEGEMAFEDVADRWLASVEGNYRKHSIERYKQMIELHLLPRWKGVPFSSIDQFDYSYYMAELSKDYGSNSLIMVNSVLKGMIRFALQEGYLEQWPFYCIEPEKDLKRASARSLCTRDARKVIDYCRSHRTKASLAILLMMYEGIHLSELCALEWKDVDLTEGVIHVRNFAQRENADEGGNRTSLFIRPVRSERELKIHPAIKALLEYWREREPACQYLLHDTKPGEPRNEARKIKDALTKIGLPDVTCAMLWKTAEEMR